MDEPELDPLYFAYLSTTMVNSGVAAMYVQLCPRNLSRELHCPFFGIDKQSSLRIGSSAKLEEPML
jgi:hypothetical protein